MHQAIKLLLIVCLCSSLLVSCGVYTFNPKGKSSISSIFIERFQNNTPEFGLADRMTDDVIDAFIADGTIKVMSAGNAESILEGTLVRYERKPYEFTSGEQVTSYAVTMDFDVVLKDAKTGAEIWKERISQQGIYRVDTETEQDGQLKAIKLLVEAIINKTTKSW